MQEVGEMRRRNGAYYWELYHESANPAKFVEIFMDESWIEHLRNTSASASPTGRFNGGEAVPDCGLRGEIETLARGSRILGDHGAPMA